MVLIYFVSNSQILSGTKNVSLDFELSETAINRAIVSQFNDPNFLFQHFNGTFELKGVPNVPYSVELTRPSVVIGANFIGIHLSFYFEASIGSIPYNYDFEVTPTITVNDASITGSNVVAFFEDLGSLINSHTEIEWEIRALLLELYNTYEPQIYSAELFNEILEEINSDEFIQQRSFSITDFEISPAFNFGKLVVKAIIEITYADTFFWTYIKKISGNDMILFKSNIKCTIDKITIWDTVPEEHFNIENLNLQLIKESGETEYYAEYNIGELLGNSPYVWSVLYKTNGTFYYNQYGGNANAWWNPSVRLNH